jgi:hypothetical protein
MAIAVPVREGLMLRSTRSIRVLAVLRLVFGLLMITGIASQYAVSLGYWRRTGLHDLGLRTADFLSAFTHEVNVAGGVILIVGGVLLLRGRGAGPGWYTGLRLALVPAILVAGIVYNLLLRPAPVPPGSQLDWANEVMHVVGPLVVLLDWLIAPRRPRLPYRSAWLVILFPIAWIAYTFIRAPLVPDELNGTPYYYPYGFLDPHGSAGWGPVLLLVGVLLVFALVLGVLAVLVWRIEDRVSTARALRRPGVPPVVAPESAATTTPTMP